MYENQNKIVVLIPTYKRNETLVSLCNSLLNNEPDLIFKIIISDNDHSNTVSIINPTLFDNIKIDYIKNQTNVGPAQNFINLLNNFLKLPDIGEDDLCLFISDDDSICGSFTRILEVMSDASLDSAIFPSYLVKDNSRIGTSVIPLFNSHFSLIADSNRILTGNVLRKRLVKKYISLISLRSLYKEFWYPMQLYTLLSSNTLRSTSILFNHTVGNLTLWGNYDNYNNMIKERILVYNHLYLDTYLRSTDLVRLKNIFVSRLPIDIIKRLQSDRINYGSRSFKYYILNVISVFLQRISNFFYRLSIK